MSGGAFDYYQNRIRDIWESIQEKLDRQGKELPKEELKWYPSGYLEEHPEEKFHTVYSNEVQKIFKEGIEILKKAEIYVRRIDWYLSGDDGEESLISSLKEDLEELNKEFENKEANE